VRIFKVTYAVKQKIEKAYDKVRICDYYPSQMFSERYSCNSIEEAMEYGKQKAEKLGVELWTILELKC
jgi:Spy/CpxP family protein refolding chaperone